MADKDETRVKGLLGRAEDILKAPEEGTALRPYISQAREAVEGVATTVTGGINTFAQQVDTTVDEQLKKVNAFETNAAGNTAQGASLISLLRPELKFGAIVGATALVSAKFGPRAFFRNTLVMSTVGGYIAYPEFLDKAKTGFLAQVEQLTGSKR